MAPSFRNYAEFWPYYLQQHSRRETKIFHTVGLFLAGVVIATAIVTGHWLWIPVALVPGYGVAWIGHTVYEGNLPATFGHPLWSFISDFRMVFLFVTGRLNSD